MNKIEELKLLNKQLELLENYKFKDNVMGRRFNEYYNRLSYAITQVKTEFYVR